MNTEKLLQKLCGIILIIIGLIAVLAFKEGTISIIAIPVGIFLLVVKKQIMEF